MGFQWQSKLAIFQNPLQALCFAEGVFWVETNKDAWTHRVWVGSWAQFGNSILRRRKAAKLLCPRSNCDCQTFY